MEKFCWTLDICAESPAGRIYSDGPSTFVPQAQQEEFI